MTYSVEAFCADCREALKRDDGPDGHEQVRRNLEKLLQNREFVDAHCGPDQPQGVRTIYRDPETGMNLLVHVYNEGRRSPPHDHGNSWAAYGQAVKYTDMTVWRRVDDGTREGHAEIEIAERFRLEPGMVGRFEPGTIHHIEFPAGARFVRVTGTDLTAIDTKRYDPEAKTVQINKKGASAAGLTPQRTAAG